MKSLRMVAGIFGVLVLTATAAQARTVTTTESTTETTEQNALAGWSSHEVWRQTVPGSTPRPGASVSGPVSVVGVTPYALLDSDSDSITRSESRTTTRNDVDFDVDADADRAGIERTETDRPVDY